MYSIPEETNKPDSQPEENEILSQIDKCIAQLESIVQVDPFKAIMEGSQESGKRISLRAIEPNFGENEAETEKNVIDWSDQKITEIKKGRAC